MALSLYPEAAYEDVFAAVAQGLSWLDVPSRVIMCPFAAGHCFEPET
jgi:hypothetical protein